MAADFTDRNQMYYNSSLRNKRLSMRIKLRCPGDIHAQPAEKVRSYATFLYLFTVINIIIKLMPIILKAKICTSQPNHSAILVIN